MGGNNTDRSNPPPLFPLPPGEGKRDIAGSVAPLRALHRRGTVQERVRRLACAAVFKRFGNRNVMTPLRESEIALVKAATRNPLELRSRREFRAALEQALHHVLVALHVEDRFAALRSQIREDRWFRALEQAWERLEPPARLQGWQELLDRLVQISYAARPYCLRCCECCRG